MSLCPRAARLQRPRQRTDQSLGKGRWRGEQSLVRNACARRAGPRSKDGLTALQKAALQKLRAPRAGPACVPGTTGPPEPHGCCRAVPPFRRDVRPEGPRGRAAPGLRLRGAAFHRGTGTGTGTGRPPVPSSGRALPAARPGAGGRTRPSPARPPIRASALWLPSPAGPGRAPHAVAPPRPANRSFEVGAQGPGCFMAEPQGQVHCWWGLSTAGRSLARTPAGDAQPRSGSRRPSQPPARGSLPASRDRAVSRPVLSLHDHGDGSRGSAVRPASLSSGRSGKGPRIVPRPSFPSAATLTSWL